MSKYGPIVARVLLGLAFLVFGLNGFLHFFAPPPAPGKAGEFGAALMASGYIFPLISVTELVAALTFLTGRFVPLGLTILAPILVNIVAFHLALEMNGIGMGLFLTLLEVYLAWSYRDAFRAMLSPNAQPAS